MQCQRYKYVPTVSSEEVVEGNPGHTTTGIVPWTPPPGHQWFVWWEYTTDTDGNDCKYVGAGWYPPPEGTEIVRLSNGAIDTIEAARGEPLPLCDDLADITGPPAPPSAAELWDAVSVHLPRPDPLWVQPGKALVGLPAWLETNRDLSFELPPSGLASMPGGLVSVTADAYFTVDWGDPSRFADPDDTEYRRQGIPPPTDVDRPTDPAMDNPDGIRHTYTVVPESGDVTITVTDHWTVTFEDAWGRTFTADGDLDTSVTIDVIEAQAVVTG